MIAEPLALLSERPLEVPTRTGLGDRFRYFRGISGRRYLFTRIEADEVADFRLAVIILARREPRGLRALWVGELDANGDLTGCSRWPQIHRRDGVVLVHLLAEKAEARCAIVTDLMRATPARA
jgi:hypothetical protein